MRSKQADEVASVRDDGARKEKSVEMHISRDRNADPTYLSKKSTIQCLHVEIVRHQYEDTQTGDGERTRAAIHRSRHPPSSLTTKHPVNIGMEKTVTEPRQRQRNKRSVQPAHDLVDVKSCQLRA